MLGLFGRKRFERAGYTLYSAAVQAARDPYLYTGLGVPDTLDGRFDLVGAHVFLLIDRLRNADEPGPAIAQAVFDAMFADMDFNLREMGVGDMSVGKRNREMWEAFHGRCMAYESALETGDPAALVDAVARNVWRGAVPPPSSPATLTDRLLRQRAAFAAMPIERFADGSAPFAEATPA